MQTPEAKQIFPTLEHRHDLEDYNYEHFRTKHLFNDFKRTLESHRVHPGQIAPDFELPRAGGGALRLSDLRGRPTLLHFGSIT